MTLPQRASQANTLSGEPDQQTTFTAFPEGTHFYAFSTRNPEAPEKIDSAPFCSCFLHDGVL
jgi:hypothetical protein